MARTPAVITISDVPGIMAHFNRDDDDGEAFWIYTPVEDLIQGISDTYIGLIVPPDMKAQALALVEKPVVVSGTIIGGNNGTVDFSIKLTKLAAAA